ncbi:MAG: glycoside hydrolase family 30 beta sandwich domain-containing protein [Saprospiraceae bacterium]
MTTGFKNPEGSIVVIVMNGGDKEVKYLMFVGGQAVSTTSQPHSITTLLF